MYKTIYTLTISTLHAYIANKNWICTTHNVIPKCLVFGRGPVEYEEGLLHLLVTSNLIL